jgi:hypothetical protein
MYATTSGVYLQEAILKLMAILGTFGTYLKLEDFKTPEKVGE